MNIALTVVAILITILWFRRWNASMRRTGAAFNVLLGKYTFLRLSDDQQKMVEARTAEILQQAMHGSFGGFDAETDKYGWYALAMNELGIRPAVEDYPTWNRVKNPFTAIFPGDPSLEKASAYIKRRFNVEISVGTEHVFFDGLRSQRAEKSEP